MTRKPIAAANWKMHFLRADVDRYFDDLLTRLGEPAGEVLFFPSAPLLPRVAERLQGSAAACGGQDLHPAAQGAHTGDTSGAQLADAGATWVLCGHSERRHNHGEDDALIGEKARAARENGLMPLICVGETIGQRKAKETFDVLRRQLEAALATEPSDFELAYEPVWAIGTGETATPEIAQEAHAFLRQELERLLGGERAAALRILYGGSVKPENAASLIAKEDIDGFLVGGASLDSGKFLDIIGACA
jgi:triosephosphate isomerase